MKNHLRRRFLARLACGGIVAAMPGFSGCAVVRASRIHFGLQLHTLKAELEKDFEGTLQEIAALGIREVEAIAFADRTPAQVRQALRGAGLRAVSLHPKPGSLARDAQGQIEAARELGVRYLITAVPEFRDRERRQVAALTLDDWRWNADLFNEVGEQARTAGVQFGYHNHQFEFVGFDGVRAYDELLARTDPALVTMQLDCGWAEYAGVDAAQLLRAHHGRFSSLHVKDIQRRASPEAGFDLPGVEVGRGVIDWKSVLAAARDGGVKHYFIEQEPPFERAPIEAVRMSYEWLTRGTYRKNE